MPKPSKRNRRLDEVEQIIGVRFKNRALLREALTHRSYLNETAKADIDHNERLEFLGDGVLGYVVRSYLCRLKPRLSEGMMTSLYAALVNGKSLSQLGEALSLGAYLYLSLGAGNGIGSDDRSKGPIMGNAVEAIIGAICIDRGIGTAELFVLEFILPRLRKIVELQSYLDAKTHFQELSQGRFGITPAYKLLLEQGPGHDKVYVVAACVGERSIAIGKGSSIQNAEIQAAHNALKEQFNITLPEFGGIR